MGYYRYVVYEETSNEDKEDLIFIHTFKEEDVAVEPEVIIYDFEEALEVGELKEENHGMLPGLGEGTWSTIVIDGIEYYFGKYDFKDLQDDATLFGFGYAIVSETYKLANGIAVGMKEEELLELYPNMAVLDFDGNYLYNKVVGHQGWNSSGYPRNLGVNGIDYYWTDQFDYIMIADIDLGNDDTLPIYVGLLMKNKVVAAITFYYPTAG